MCMKNEVKYDKKEPSDSASREDILNACCVIIPTYNNSRTLAKVIEGLLNYTEHVLVVNDGSTDKTDEILKGFRNRIVVEELKPNRGKGHALKQGFKKALSLGYDYAITIDSDGQHYPEDLPIFVDEISKNPGTLLIGSRNMTHDSVPKNSSFGNRFSNFWFWFETGVKLNDTQSGYRCYPLADVGNLTYFTGKFEFEIESIVRAAWNGVEIKNIPIRVYYGDDRVSHFRPYKDFLRISMLNTVLVIIALLYIKPRDFIRKIRSKGLKEYFKEHVINSDSKPYIKACSIALGVFIGIAPFWGFQTILVLTLAAALKLNKLIAFVFSNISIPPNDSIHYLRQFKIGPLAGGFGWFNA